MIDLLYNNVDSLTTGVDDLSASMKQGSSVTKEMAEAINNTPEQKFQVLKQQIHNNAEELGNGLLPAVNDTMDKVSGLIKRGGEWISNNQQTVQTIMNIALKLGVFLVVAGSVMGIVGSLGKLFLSMKNTIGIVKTAVMGLNTAFLASPVTWVIAGIVALIAIFVVLWNKSEAFRNFWKGLFAQVQNAVQQAWTSIQPALQKLGQKLTELWQAVQPIIRINRKSRNRCPDCPWCYFCRGDTGSTLSTDPSDQCTDKLRIIRDQRGECGRCTIPGRFFRSSRLCISRSR